MKELKITITSYREDGRFFTEVSDGKETICGSYTRILSPEEVLDSLRTPIRNFLSVNGETR